MPALRLGMAPNQSTRVHRRTAERMRERVKRRILRVATVAGSLLITLVALELVFRLFSPPRPPVPRDSGENALAVDTARNVLGLREPWDEVPGGDQAVRIAFLGDSFTFAACVEQREGFVHQVEEILNPAGALRYVTINLGQPGTEPQVQSEMYRRLKGRLRPDVVVHVLYCNDLGHDLYDELKMIHAMQNRRSRAAHVSHLWGFVEGRIRYTMVKRRTLDYFRGGDSPFRRRQAWERLRAGVESVVDMARSDGTRYVLVMFPWLFSLDDYPLEDVHARMRRLAGELGVPFLDLLETFRGLDARALRISVTDEHPNPEAHTLAAEAIAGFLRANDVIE